MGFQNTSQRYEYIFGSSVRQLDAGIESQAAALPARPDESPSARPEKKLPGRRRRRRQAGRAERQKAIERNRAFFLSFDWKYTFIIVVSLFFVLMGALAYVRETAVITAKERQIYAMKEEKVRLLSKQSALESEIEKGTDLRKIEEYAKKNLGMVYPTRDMTIYYTGGSDDYFRQYEIVDSK